MEEELEEKMKEEYKLIEIKVKFKDFRYYEIYCILYIKRYFSFIYKYDNKITFDSNISYLIQEIDKNIISKFDNLLSQSVKIAFDNPLASRSFVKEHAQELEDEVIDKHIALFVNDYTISLGEEGHKAVEKLLNTQTL